jgi:hypothetical protein
MSHTTPEESITFTVYHGSQIMWTGMCSESELHLQGKFLGYSVIEGWYLPELWYMNGKVPTLRPALDIPETKDLAVDEEWVFNAPANTKVSINGITQPGDVTSLEFGIAGEFVVDFTPVHPHLKATCLVTVT